MDLLDRARERFHAGESQAPLRWVNESLASDALDDRQRLQAWLLKAALHDQLAEAEATIDAADQAAALATRLDDLAAGAEALCFRAGGSFRLGLIRDAFECTVTALKRARALDHPVIESRALRQMSNLALRHGDEDEVYRLLDQSLACARRGGDAGCEFWALNNISNMVGIQAARLAEAGDRAGAARLVDRLVQVVHEALAVAERTGHWLQRAFALSNLADAYIVNGDHVRARDLLQQYVALARQGGSPRLLAYANMDEVRMLRAEGRGDEAVRHIDNDAHRRLLVGNQDIALSTETTLYELHKAAGRFEAALRHHEVAARMDVERLNRVAEEQVSVMMARLDLEQARAAEERARLDAELSDRRAQLLELEREQLQRAAHEDALTGAGNRRAADAALAQRLAGTPAEPVLVALVDIDHFKAVNDTHGHAAGDAVLATMGQLMKAGLRSRDQVFRFGGEEFLLLLADTTLETGLDVCERLRLAIQGHDWSSVAPGLVVTASFGLARGLGPGEPAELVRKADEALYGAKRGGRNRVAVA